MLRYRAAAVTAAALFFCGPVAAQSTCDRSCLEGLLDAYVEAVVAHDPKQLPLARGAKFTENGQRLEVGDGLWHTATEKGGYALKLADVERGQAVLMGTIREAASRRSSSRACVSPTRSGPSTARSRSSRRS